MDIYLDIAQRVLRQSRTPMSAREMLKLAYGGKIVPARLYGKTQQKTMQARLSEDILVRRERSLFFRTKPGVFFLREFLTDTSIPEEFRVPIIARRRERELVKQNPLAFASHTLNQISQKRHFIPTADIIHLLKNHKFHYATSTKERSTTDILVWAFVLVMRGNLILTYRHGRYREDRDNFLKKRSVGFFSPVLENDLSLFDQTDHGIVASGMRALQTDLDLNDDGSGTNLTAMANLNCFVRAQEGNGADDLLAIVAFQCPNWFEPLTRRLAINDLAWHDLATPINHLEDFDPWSREVLDHACSTLKQKTNQYEATQI